VLKLQPLPVNPGTEKVDSTPSRFESEDEFSSKASLAFVTSFLVSDYQCHKPIFFTIPQLTLLMSKLECLSLAVFLSFTSIAGPLH
jgi:hypothetical protein